MDHNDWFSEGSPTFLVFQPRVPKDRRRFRCFYPGYRRIDDISGSSTPGTEGSTTSPVFLPRVPKDRRRFFGSFDIVRRLLVSLGVLRGVWHSPGDSGSWVPECPPLWIDSHTSSHDKVVIVLGGWQYECRIWTYEVNVFGSVSCWLWFISYCPYCSIIRQSTSSSCGRLFRTTLSVSSCTLKPYDV